VPLPDAVDYGQVRWHAIQAEIDSIDADDEPDAVAVTGTVTFEMSVPMLLAQGGPDPVTIFVKPIKATLGLDGILRDDEGHDPVKLIATDSPALNPQSTPSKPLTWKATPRLNGGLKMDPFFFELPAGTTVDLTDVARIPASTGTPITRGLKGDPGVPTTGYFTAPLVEGDIFSVELVSNWGIDVNGVPYYDPDGADPGEAALLTLDPATGEPILLRPAGS
jgi:hypothetical protein